MTRTLYVVGGAVLGMALLQVTWTGVNRPQTSHAESAADASRLDSRTIPHPEWVQVSGQIEETVRMKPDGQNDRLLVLLQPVEGGRVVVDLGAADGLESVRLEEHDYIHVRGTPLQNGKQRTIIAGELIADGKVVPIEREPGSTTTAARAETGGPA
jgi:hypothetical protein